MRSSPEEVMKELEEMAKRLVARKCPYMAATLMRYYDGDYTQETKELRLKAARKYEDLAREQAADKEAQQTPK